MCVWNIQFRGSIKFEREPICSKSAKNILMAYNFDNNKKKSTYKTD